MANPQKPISSHGDRVKTQGGCVRIVPIFNHLDDESMDLIASKVVTQTYKKGEYLYQAGDKSSALFVINSGLVRIFRIVESGKEQLVRILNAGDFTGEWTIFNPDSVYEDYAQAIKDTKVCTIQQEELQNFLKAYPEISLKLLAEMSNRLDKSDRHATHVATEQVGTRLSLFISDQIKESEGDGDVIVELPLSRKDIASYLGTTPETISRKFKQLEDEGYLTQMKGKKIKVHDVNDLLLYSE